MVALLLLIQGLNLGPDWLTCLRLSAVFASPKNMPREYQKLGHDHFFPHVSN
jgi:hypothetical protein